MKTESIIKKANKVIQETYDNIKDTTVVTKKSKKKSSAKKFNNWDFTKDDEIPFFDASLSYELTGYRPITKYEGLDFDPNWFTEARETFKATGKYTSYLFGSKGYKDFWHEEYRRCRDGLTVNGYTVTGDHYFFLNYYQLPIISDIEKAGTGRKRGFPEFMVAQYQFFHYLELAKILHKHAVLMKARGIGFSEINAAMAANKYTTIRESVSLVACYDRTKLDKTLDKVWRALQFLDTHTDGGMFKLRQLSDTLLEKKSGHYKMVQGNKVPAGWQSTIEGIVADDPTKIRGDRVDLIILDEFGSWKDSIKAFVQAQALVEIQGASFGTITAGGRSL